MTQTMPAPVSGDLCHLLRNAECEHYRCDDYADGTITNVITGAVVVKAKVGALRGFTRPKEKEETK